MTTYSESEANRMLTPLIDIIVYIIPRDRSGLKCGQYSAVLYSVQSVAGLYSVQSQSRAGRQALSLSQSVTLTRWGGQSVSQSDK